MKPAASVVIPTHRRPVSLTRVLEGLGRQDAAAGTFEVVVVCDGLADPALTVLEDDAFGFPLRMAEQTNQGPAAARNRGVALAQGDLIVFIDDDVVPSPRFVRAHLEAHGQADDLVVVGPLLPPAGHGSPTSPWIRFEGRTLEEQYRAMEAGEWPMGPRQFYTGNASVRRSRIVEAGGFDESYRRAEDVELAYRLRDLGLRFHFECSAHVLHLAERSYGSWLDIGYRYGRADVRMGRCKGRQDVLESAGREFHWRHPLTRRLVRLAFAVPPAGRLIEQAARPVALITTALGNPSLADRILAGAFNLAYWRGVAGEMGSRDAARQLIAQQAAAAAAWAGVEAS